MKFQITRSSRQNQIPTTFLPLVNVAKVHPKQCPQWEIDIPDLETLIALSEFEECHVIVKTFKDCVPQGEPTIEIYDDYRE